MKERVLSDDRKMSFRPKADACRDRLSLLGLREQSLQFLGREVEVELTILGYGDMACLLGNDDNQRV